METCKHLFNSYIPHYRVKSIIPLLQLYMRKPVFRKDASPIPRPIIVLGSIGTREEFDESDALLHDERPARRTDVDSAKLTNAKRIISNAHHNFRNDPPAKARAEIRTIFGLTESEDEAYDSPIAALGYDFRILARKEFYSLEELYLVDDMCPRPTAHYSLPI